MREVDLAMIGSLMEVEVRERKQDEEELEREVRLMSWCDL